MERTYSLPETIDQVSLRSLHRNAEAFQDHVVQLEKEAFCEYLLSLFILAPYLHSVSLDVRASVRESDSPPYWPYVHYELTAYFRHSNDQDEEPDALGQVSAEQEKALVENFFTPALAKFCEGLRISRGDLYLDAGTPRYAAVRELVNWIDFDLKA